MPARPHVGSTHDQDLFGRKRRQTKKPRIEPPSLTREEALNITGQLSDRNLPQDSSATDKEDEWIDFPNTNRDFNSHIDHSPPPPETSSAVELLQKDHRAYVRAQKRQAKNERWAALEEQIFSTYLMCQHDTKNWTTKHCYLSNTPPCTCSSDQIQHRPVDLIGLDDCQSKYPVNFCQCLSDLIRLLHFGYFAASPQLPRTAFSVKLIHAYHHVWNRSVIATSRFIDGWMDFLDYRNHKPLYPTQKKAQPRKSNCRTLRRPFTEAIDTYWRVLSLQQRLSDHALSPTALDKLSDRCPPCFGLSYAEVKASPHEPTVIVAMDGNFQHRHLSHASKDTVSDQQYPPVFLSPSEINPHASVIQSTESQGKSVANPCSDSHTAANDVRNSSSWDKCDDTGLFGSTCPHDIPLKLANIYKTGEKMYYPIAILNRLMSDVPNTRFGVLYDIGCHLEAHVQKRQLLPNHAANLTFGTSVFHAYVHNWACQIKYNPRYNAYWGLSDGEGLERLWSYLSPLVSLLRHCTRLHRLQAIHWLLEFYTRKLKHTSAQWLVQKLSNALNVSNKAKMGLCSIYALPNPATPGINYTEDFLRDQWKKEKLAMSSKNRVAETQRLELGRLLSLQDKLLEAWNRPAHTPEQALADMESHTQIAKEIAEQRLKVGDLGLTNFENDLQKECFLKLWHSKHVLVEKYISVCELKRPLDKTRDEGRQSSLGTRGKTLVVDAVRKQAVSLKKLINNYQKFQKEYRGACPQQPAPPNVQLSQLFHMKADDPFWTDSFFTNSTGPWAVDPNTQYGMCQLAYQDRAVEEIQHLGWEVRRAMRWAVNTNYKLWNSIKTIESLNPTSSDITTRLLTHRSLSSLDDPGRIVAAKVLLHKEFLKVLVLQEAWDLHVLEVMQRTRKQDGDENLEKVWSAQVTKISEWRYTGKLSQIPGVFFANVVNQENIIPQTPEEPNSEEPSDDDDDSSEEDSDEEDFEGALNSEELE